MKTYPIITKLTPAQKDQLAVYRDEWTKVVLSTGLLSAEEREKVIVAVKDLYRFSKLSEPKVVIVPSPIVMARAGGAAAWWWHNKKQNKGFAESPNTQSKEALLCSQKWYSSAQGGNVWGGWCAHLCFWRDVMGLGERPELKETYERFAVWETLTRLTHWRWMSPDFCMVSEKPIKLVVELRSGVCVPHCLDGPTHEYADGWKIHHIDGVRVPEHVVMEPDKITLEEIASEKNAEIRRVMRTRYGEGRYLKDTGAKLLCVDYESARKGAAPRALMLDNTGQRWLVGTDGSTGRVYYMCIPENEKEVTTCQEAHNLLCGFDESRILNKS